MRRRGLLGHSRFGRSKRALLEPLLKLRHGVPSHDTFSRVFRLLDPVAFEAAFARFMAAFGGRLKGVVSIDGKALRGAYVRGRRSSPLHLVNIWAAQARLAVGQRLAPGRNEVAGVLEALALLTLDDCIVTADALHCRADIAQAILERGGQYVLGLKDNHPTLLAQARRCLDTGPCDQATSHDRGHDRIERREARIVAVPQLAQSFPAAAAVACIQSVRQLAGHEPTVAIRHFILSTPIPAQRLLEVVRDHWGIENQLHWLLDVALAEDADRSRLGHAPQNLALMRKLALNLLRTHPENISIRRKIKRAAWDDAFLTTILAHMR